MRLRQAIPRPRTEKTCPIPTQGAILCTLGQDTPPKKTPTAPTLHPGHNTLHPQHAIPRPQTEKPAQSPPKAQNHAPSVWVTLPQCHPQAPNPRRGHTSTRPRGQSPFPRAIPTPNSYPRHRPVHPRQVMPQPRTSRTRQSPPRAQNHAPTDRVAFSQVALRPLFSAQPRPRRNPMHPRGRMLSLVQAILAQSTPRAQ